MQNQAVKSPLKNGTTNSDTHTDNSILDELLGVADETITEETITEEATETPIEEPAYIFDINTIRDRILGAVLGGAIADAVALQVEGEDVGNIAERFGRRPEESTLGLPYKGIYRGYPSGDWTDATDTTVLVMRSLAAYFAAKTDTIESDFATRLVNWHKNGFPELEDHCGLTPESVTLRALGLTGFTEDPAAVAATIKGPKAENGALIRSAPCAFTKVPAEWASVFSRTTHADDRSTAAAVTYSLLLHELLRLPTGARVPPGIVVGPVTAGRNCIVQLRAIERGPDSEQLTRRSDFMRRLTETSSFEDLHLDDRDHRSYVVKTLACAIWAVRQLIRTAPAKRTPAFFIRTIRQLASQGGDATANCAVAGTILGAVLGMSSLPADWIEKTPAHEWLIAETDAFITAAKTTWVLEQ